MGYCSLMNTLQWWCSTIQNVKTGCFRKLENPLWGMIAEKLEWQDHKLIEFVHKEMNHSFFNFTCTYVFLCFLENFHFLFHCFWILFQLFRTFLFHQSKFYITISVSPLKFYFTISVSSLQILFHYFCFTAQLAIVRHIDGEKTDDWLGIPNIMSRAVWREIPLVRWWATAHLLFHNFCFIAPHSISLFVFQRANSVSKHIFLFQLCFIGLLKIVCLISSGTNAYRFVRSIAPSLCCSLLSV